MKVSEILTLAKSSFLSQIAVKNNDEAILLYISLALTELYDRFNLSIKTEVITTNNATSVYDLRSEDISQVLAVYDSNRKELISASVISDDSYDYKQLNFRTFLLTNPKDEELFFVYKASSPTILNINDNIAIPNAMVIALLNYVAYLGHTGINRDGKNEADGYLIKFENSCNKLELQGYKINLSTASLSVHSKGFA